VLNILLRCTHLLLEGRNGKIDECHRLSLNIANFLSAGGYLGLELVILQTRIHLHFYCNTLLDVVHLILLRIAIGIPLTLHLRDFLFLLLIFTRFLIHL
jgi:hypothetical protein